MRAVEIVHLVAALTALSVVPALPAKESGPPTVDVRVVEGELEVRALPPVELAEGASVRVANETSDPVPVTLVEAAILPARLLPPGGRTIGGPGFFEAAFEEAQFILGGFVNGDPHLMCYTFVNLGPGGFSIFGLGHQAGDFQDVMSAGEQETHCGLVTGVRIECDFGGQPCSGVYRVDLVE